MIFAFGWGQKADRGQGMGKQEKIISAEDRKRKEYVWSVVGGWIRVIVVALFLFRIGQIYGFLLAAALAIIAYAVFCNKDKTQ